MTTTAFQSAIEDFSHAKVFEHLRAVFVKSQFVIELNRFVLNVVFFFKTIHKHLKNEKKKQNNKKVFQVSMESVLLNKFVIVRWIAYISLKFMYNCSDRLDLHILTVVDLWMVEWHCCQK